MSGMDIIHRLRAEPFNRETERRLREHPYLAAAEQGTLTLAQRRAFAREQYHIQLSDARSFAVLAGHRDFAPKSLTGAIVPTPLDKKSGDAQDVDLFQFLLGGEVYAARLLLKYSESVGLDEKALRSPEQYAYQRSAKAQAYPSYWARMALSDQRAAGAAACAVNFPAWGEMCGRLLKALGGGGEGSQYDYAGVDDEGLEFVKFFATPIDGLDKMAAAIIEREGVAYEDLVEHVRLLQTYEVLFWDGVCEQS